MSFYNYEFKLQSTVVSNTFGSLRICSTVNWFLIGTKAKVSIIYGTAVLSSNVKVI